MYVEHNFDKTPRQDCPGGEENSNGTEAIFGLTEESGQHNFLKPAGENPDQTNNFLQKLHIRNHELTSKETIYELPLEEAVNLENEPELFSEEDEYLFEDVRQAISEKDIIDLRANLQSILQANPNLGDDISLYREIDEAIGEKDIMQLRSDLRIIIQSETSHSQSYDEIEDYLSDELNDSSKLRFDNELMNNDSLAEDVKLFHEINESLCEKDVMKLRADLQRIRRESIEPENQQKRGMFFFKRKHTIWYVAAASIILLLGINVIFRGHTYTNPELYKEFYQPVKSDFGATRSETKSEDSRLNQAMAMMSSKEYDRALALFSDFPANESQNAVGNFYSGAIYQAKGEYSNAVQSFTKVLSQGDNLFIEQSEWYLGLCYLNLNQREKAILQFRKISGEKGYYQRQSMALLKKLEQE